VGADGTWEQYTLDSQGNLQKIVLSDNSQFLYDWSSSNGPVVTVVTSDGTTAVSAALPPAAASAARRKAKPSKYASSGSATPFIEAHVTSCNGSVNEDWASVYVSAPGGTIPAQLVGPGTGNYEAQLPSGPLSNALQAAKAVTGIPCTLSNIVSNSCKVITAAVIILGDGIPVLEAGAIYASCTNLGVAASVLSAVCTSIQAGSYINSFISWFENQLGQTFGLPVTAYLNASSTSQQKSTMAIYPVSGTYPTAEFQFGCSIVDHVNVLPSPVTINVGDQIFLTATANDANNQVLLSSAFGFIWSGGGGVATVTSSYASGSGTIISSGLVTGVAVGTANITATETSSAKQGTANVNVQGGLVGTSWDGTYQWPTSCTTCVQGPQSMELAFSTSTTANGSFDATMADFSGTIASSTFNLTSTSTNAQGTWSLIGTLANGAVTGTVTFSCSCISSGSQTGTFTLSPEPPATTDVLRINHD